MIKSQGDFMLALTKNEFKVLRSNISTSKRCDIKKAFVF